MDECRPKATSDGYTYIHDKGEFHGSARKSTGLVKGVRMQYFRDLACSGNEVMDANGDTAGGSCAGAATSCPPGQMRRWIFSRRANDPTAPPRQPNYTCIGAPVNIPLADVQAALIRHLRQADLPIPTMITAPPNGGLVNLPHIFATTDHPLVTLNVTVPLPATLTARPHYTWNYGDGTTGPDSPGRPFEPGTLPADHPNHYLTHT